MLSRSRAELRSAAGLPLTSSRFGRLLIEGEARLRGLRVGSYLMVAPNQRHRVEWTDAHVPTGLPSITVQISPYPPS